MKKLYFLALLVSLSVFGVRANDEFNDGLLENMDIKTFVSTLNDIEGYFFVGKGEVRDISMLLSRPDNTVDDPQFFQNMKWRSLNSTIAQVEGGSGQPPLLTGGVYGETIVSGIETKDDGTTDTHNYVVFVCPIITIVSPEGAIYSYHKVYNQNTRIQFTQSAQYSINNVMRYDSANKQGIDITDDIDADGWYESFDPIQDDTVFWVAMESNNKAGDADTATGDATIKVTVNDHDVILTGNDKVLNGDFTVKDLWGKVIYNGKWQTDADGNYRVTFYPGNRGVFFLTSHVTDKTYKFVIHSLDS